jgi:hypothetical protein
MNTKAAKCMSTGTPNLEIETNPAYCVRYCYCLVQIMIQQGNKIILPIKVSLNITVIKDMPLLEACTIQAVGCAHGA